MMRTMRQVGKKEPLAQWDPERAGEDKLADVKGQFDVWLSKGGIAFDVSIENKEEGADGTMMDVFDKNKDILLVPHVQGGAQ